MPLITFVASYPSADSTADPRSVTVAVGAGEFLAAFFRMNAAKSALVAGPSGFTEDKFLDAGSVYAAMWSKANCTGSETSVAFDLSSNPQSALTVMRFAGVALTTPADQSNSASATNTDLAPGSITPTEDNELVLTMVATDLNNGTGETIDGGFTYLDLTSSNRLSTAYLIQTTLAASNPTHHWTTSRAAKALQVSYRANLVKFALGVNLGLSVPATAATLAVGAEV